NGVMKNLIFVISFFVQHHIYSQSNLTEDLRILTHEEFVELGQKDLARVNKRPYIIEATHEPGGKLLYYGSSHFYDPDDPMIKDIEDKWHSFKPDIALWEGGIPN